MAVSYILIRPPQLPELGDPSDAFIVGYDPATDKTVKIKVANLRDLEVFIREVFHHR